MLIISDYSLSKKNSESIFLKIIFFAMVLTARLAHVNLLFFYIQYSKK